MGSLLDEGQPIFLQIAERIEDDIINGVLAEEARIPSTNQFAAFYQINPATAAKGVNMLVDDGILYKKRGIGMFVKTGARSALVRKRRAQFFSQYVEPMLREAARLGIGPEQLAEMVQKGGTAGGTSR